MTYLMKPRKNIIIKKGLDINIDELAIVFIRIIIYKSRDNEIAI